MTKQTEALRLALEALERGETELRWKAITALREAREEQATEDNLDATIIQYHEATIKRLEARIAEIGQPTQHQCKFPMCHNEEYQQALAGQIERELVGEQPAQRTWVGLTDEKIEEIAAITLFPIEFARAIETKLKEKNT